jgi:hypothetical protein
MFGVHKLGFLREIYQWKWRLNIYTVPEIREFKGQIYTVEPLVTDTLINEHLQ